MVARSTGDLVLERERLRQLVSLNPGSILYDAATLRLTESFLESGDFSAAVTSARVVGTSKNVSIAREGTLLMGQALVRAGKVVEARDVFSKLVMQMPDASRPDDFALASVRELDELAKRTDIPAFIYPRQTICCARRFTSSIAISWAQGIITRQLSMRIRKVALCLTRSIKLVESLYLEGKYEDAIKSFQRVVDQFSQSQSARDALAQLAASYLRLKRTDDAIAAYKLAISKFPEGPNLERDLP